MNFGASELIATCAFALTIYEVYATRAHNKLSVRPLLDSNTARAWDDSGLTLSFTIRNVGVGPAIVRAVRFFYDGEPAAATETIESLVRRSLASAVAFRIRQHGLPGIGCGMPPGSEHCLVRIEFPKLVAAGEELVDARLDAIGIEIDYESLYGDKWTFSRRNKTQSVAKTS